MHRVVTNHRFFKTSFSTHLFFFSFESHSFCCVVSGISHMGRKRNYNFSFHHCNNYYDGRVVINVRSGSIGSFIVINCSIISVYNGIQLELLKSKKSNNKYNK